MLKPNVQNFAETFAAWAARPDLGIGAAIREEARVTLVDTLACTVIGTPERQALAAMEAMAFGLSAGSVQPTGGGAMLSLHGAALVNGVRTHAIDFDDYELSGSSHASAPILGALFALAQKVPMTVDRICEAWLVGYETVIWMGKALGYGHYDIGWHSTSTLGPIGTAAACARALGLSPFQMANAMALAASSSAGLKMQFGFDAKAIHAGLAAESGLRAALLARGNATGNCNLWDSDFGFARVYGTAESIGFSAMMQEMELGRAVELFPVVRKLWPSCAYTHRPIHGAEALHRRLAPGDEIASIRVRMPEPFHRVAGFGVPTNDAEARFSVRYCVVTGLTTGHVVPEDFRPARFSDPERQRMTAAVELDLYRLPKGDPGDIGPSTPETITVTLADGRVLEQVTSDVPGGVAMPMTRAQLLRKVADCGCSAALAERFLEADGAAPLDEIGILAQHHPAA
ncbi:MmgE/PrpD family protein [Paralimibaculum aggregatum]|uniref:MmgE/PrpD family protein n=1 Tax=Paralimibaculum aggregatum TaxID=3036245 RepID=A0ABQ6LJI8_9RHOB|nr:MmgE/PrpD family protein [Limibaculum sp. NKW23]GMG80834.1 MmgE/PrpD family protein [Limibaculum sp. NKW23]